ncbi:hypothetical protein F5Y18DRAFT_256576 [Xylariaceae sp. FL1019]|nr:hypothetical protein F5Y18DRAFT_256576 [Xylariaceae sp. FL1019]
MAELALGVVGIALAWKGILDFGELVLKLAANDERRREGLSIQLEVSQYMLRDWGDYWGIDRDDGRFHRFEPSRKELIMKIVFRLHESRMKAMQTLNNRYSGLPRDSEGNNDGAEKRLGRMVDRVRAASKRAKDKGTWILQDESEITDLVNETKQLHESLQHLTHGSTSYIIDMISRQKYIHPVPSRKNSFKLAPIVPDTDDFLADSLPYAENDEQTLASEATMSIISAYQSGLIQDRIDRAFHFHGDARIPELLFPWWDDNQASLILLETPDQPNDVTGTTTCALVYYLAECNKLIYAFESDASVEPTRQFTDMLRTLLIRMATLCEDHKAGALPLPKYVAHLEKELTDDRTIQDLISQFCQVLEALVLKSRSRLLLILDGLERIGASEDCDLTKLTQIFISNIRSICDRAGCRSLLKVLLCCKGHALELYPYIGDESIADITDYPLQEVSLIQELATWL